MGRCANWIHSKGRDKGRDYGFIEAEHGGDQIFVHESGLNAGTQRLQQGDIVSYEFVQNPRRVGEMMASHVRVEVRPKAATAQQHLSSSLMSATSDGMHDTSQVAQGSSEQPPHHHQHVERVASSVGTKELELDVNQQQPQPPTSTNLLSGPTGMADEIALQASQAGFAPQDWEALPTAPMPWSGGGGGGGGVRSKSPSSVSAGTPPELDPSTTPPSSGPEKVARSLGKRMTGRCAKWIYSKSFGYIDIDNGGDRVFVHETGLAGGARQRLQQGDRVSLELVQNPRRPGEMMAANVRVADVVTVEHGQPHAPTRITGRCANWIHSKDYGFIDADNGDENIFVHVTGLAAGLQQRLISSRGSARLVQDDRVSFELIRNPRRPGEWMASNVRVEAKHKPAGAGMLHPEWKARASPQQIEFLQSDLGRMYKLVHRMVADRAWEFIEQTLTDRWGPDLMRTFESSSLESNALRVMLPHIGEPKLARIIFCGDFCSACHVDPLEEDPKTGELTATAADVLFRKAFFYPNGRPQFAFEAGQLKPYIHFVNYLNINVPSGFPVVPFIEWLRGTDADLLDGLNAVNKLTFEYLSLRLSCTPADNSVLFLGADVAQQFFEPEVSAVAAQVVSYCDVVNHPDTLLTSDASKPRESCERSNLIMSAVLRRIGVLRPDENYDAFTRLWSSDPGACGRAVTARFEGTTVKREGVSEPESLVKPSSGSITLMSNTSGWPEPSVPTRGGSGPIGSGNDIFFLNNKSLDDFLS